MPFQPSPQRSNAQAVRLESLRFAFPIPAKYQGKRMAFDVGADTKYHAHRGKLLRHREGIRVGSISELGQGHALGLVLLGLPLLGALVVSRAAKARMVFPTGVAETLPPDAQTGSRNSLATRITNRRLSSHRRQGRCIATGFAEVMTSSQSLTKRHSLPAWPKSCRESRSARGRAPGVEE